MKPQAPQRPPSSILSPGAILASLRANSVTPTANMTRAASVPRRLISKNESVEIKRTDILLPQPMKVSIAEKQYTEEAAELSLEAPRIGLSEVRKGILVKRRERLNALGNSLNKTANTAEENRRSSVIRLFTDSKDTTPVNREERDIKSRQPVRGSQDLLEELRTNENILDFSTESRKNKKVTFTFNTENSEVPERLNSSLGRRIGKITKNSFFSEKEANLVSKNRAFRLIAETLGPSPKIVSEGVNLVNGYDISINTRGKDVRPAIKEENIKKISGGTPMNNSLTIEGLIDIENKEGMSDFKQYESLKKFPIKKLPSILSPAAKVNSEISSIASLDKPNLTAPIKKESSFGAIEEASKNKLALAHSSSLSVLGEKKAGKGYYNYNVDRLRKKDDSYVSVNESKLRMSIQHNLSLNKGWKVIDPEQVMMDAREEYRKKIFSLLRKQQSTDTLTSIV